jgi:hypothetical protein
MIVLYWTAAVLAFLTAAHSAIRLRRDRSVMVATSMTCMLALSASLALTAAVPALLQARPADPVAAWVACSLGLLAAWTFLAMLATVIGDTDRPLALMAIPVLGAVFTGLLQMALQHVGHTVAGARTSSALPAVVAQLALLTYYCPALGRIATLAWRCSRRIPVRHINLGMRAVAAAAVAELALILARSAAIIVASSGVPVAGPEIAGLALAQAVLVIQIIVGATVSAWFPAVASVTRQGLMWRAYWRLRPLWVALGQAAPEVELPQQPGKRFSIGYLLHRRVIEIRDAQLTLRPYWRPDVAGRAAVAAGSAGLPTGRRNAVVEAAVIVTAIDGRLHGAPPRQDDVPPVPIGPAHGDDLDAEAASLVQVSQAIRRSPIVRSIGARPRRSRLRWPARMPARHQASGRGLLFGGPSGCGQA